MPGALPNQKRQITNVIKHFKFEELQTNVLPLFPEISWNQIRTDLIETHQSFSVLNVTKIIERVIDDCKLADKHLKTRLSLLEVIDVSRHHMKKIWYTYELKGSKKKINFMTKREIKTEIIESFLEYHVNAEVQTTSNNGIMFVAIKEKPKQKKSVRVTPIFFALLLGQKHFFCSRKNVTSPYIKVISNTMGYNDSKKVQLFGRDLPSLIKLIWQKRQGAIDTNINDVPYQDLKPLIKSTGIDFTQGKHRKQYVETFFGAESPQVETLTLKCPESVWSDEEAFEKLPNEKFFLGWNLGSLNINNFLQNLAKEKILQLPLPSYLSQWTTSGKNYLTLKET